MKGRLYTVKEAARLTGLSTELIRKWEERYGAVRPGRFPNGYRGYAREDIDKLAALKSRVDSGTPIGLAVQQLAPETEKRPSPAECGSGNKDEPLNSSGLDGGDRLLEHFLNLDSAAAQQYFDRLLAIHQIDYVLLNILQPVLVELGERWIRGEISEYQEHFGTHFVREKLSALKNLFSVRSDRPLVVTACGPGETHELGILFFGYFAMQQGYRIVHLGASPSEKGILDCLDGLRPLAFLFSFTTEDRLGQAQPFLREMDKRIADRRLSTKVIIGGRIVTDDRLLEGTTAIYFLSGNARDTVKKLKRRFPVL